MRIRTLTSFTALVLVVAACGTGESADTTTPAPVTAPAPEAVLLSYSLKDGQTFTYEVTLDQQIEMTVEGDPTALGEEDMPGDVSITVNGTSTITQEIADGPEPGTFAVTVTGDFSDLEFAGTIDGEQIEKGETPDFAEMGPIDVTIIVDEQGHIIPEENPDLGEDLFGGLGQMDMLEQFAPGAGIGQFIGPPFSDQEVTVGDTWSDTVEIPTMPGSDPVTSQIDSEVVGTDTVEGHDVFVIETTTATSAIDFDLAEILIGFLTAFVPDDATDEERAEIDQIASELRFAFAVDPQTANLTTWFDAAEGVTRQAEYDGVTHMTMDMKVPNDESGEMVEMKMDMSIDQTVGYRLVSLETA